VSTEVIVSNDFKEAEEGDERIISLTPNARSHLSTLRKADDTLYIRMGVRSGGCSGMSYVMDLMKGEDIVEEDHIENFDEIKVQCVIDPKSLLYIYGMELDYSNELIGGGFKFQNPNAETSCGCGKSFGV
jgi:iron-sulfur cluster assembly accessory protein